MAARTNQANDFQGLLHAGQVTVSTAGFTDPAGNPWILMNDTAAAVNGLIVTNGATGTGPTISVGGPSADTNAAITIKGSGTGATVLGSSVSAVTLAGTPSVSSNLSVTGTLTVTGTVTSSTINSSGNLTTSSALKVNLGASSSQFTSIQFATSSLGPTIQIGSSIPTSVCNVGSLFLNTGGSSTTALYICMPNAGGASSSNWDNVTGIA